MRLIRIKNDSGQNQTINGSVLADQELLTLDTYQSLENFRSNNVYIQLVGSQDLIVQDENGDINNTSIAMSWLFQDNPNEISLSTKDNLGNSLIVTTKPNYDFITIPTHNFCDSSTWTSSTDSMFIIRPPAGKIYLVNKVELQVTNDVQINGVTTFYQDIRNDHVGVVDQKIFDSALKVMDFANKIYPVMRVDNMITDGQNFIFDYPSSIILNPSDPAAAHELVYYVNNGGTHTPAGGQYLTVAIIVDIKDV